MRERRVPDFFGRRISNDETVPRSVDRVLRELGMGCTEYWNVRVVAYGGNPALFSAQYAVADHPYVRSEMFGPNSRF